MLQYCYAMGIGVVWVVCEISLGSESSVWYCIGVRVVVAVYEPISSDGMI